MATTVRTIPFARPWIEDSDRAAVLDVLGGHILTHGPQCHEFEAEFAAMMGGGHCVSMSSCMAALHMAYFHLGIGAGDEVVVPAQTHVATVHAVELVGARPVFVDCQAETGNLDPAGVEAAITPRTRAIALVHFLGIPAPMRELLRIAQRHDLKVIEDCALAVGTRLDGVHAGLFGDAGCFSFYPVKHITTGEGGMLVSRHEAVAKGVARQRAFGVDRTFAQRTLPGSYDVVELGLNYRMSEMQAALGRRQLEKVDTILERRRHNFETLRDALADDRELTILDVQDPAGVNSHYCLSVVLGGRYRDQRVEIIRRLNEQGVGTSIYYPHPVPRLGYYREKYGYTARRFPNAERISDASIALPVGPHLEADDVEYIGETFNKVLKEI